jgi:hypothetical protein
MIDWIKRMWAEHAEWRWAAIALGLWLVVGMVLEPVTATVSLDFVHKITAGIFRAAVAVWLTFLEVRLVFPTIHEWIGRGGFKDAFGVMDPGEMPRIYATSFITAMLFVGNVIALSL